MKVEDYFKGEATAVKHCPVRDGCAMGALCGLALEEGQTPLYPAVAEVEPGELLWSDLRYEQRVFVIRNGIFACITGLLGDREVPMALCGSGYNVGLAELYIDREFTSTYYLRALTGGRVCSFPAKALRHRLEEMEQPVSHKIISCSLINLVAATYAQSKMLAQTRLYDRVVELLVRLRELALRDGSEAQSLSLTHGDVAQFVSSDRASVTRTLHKLETDGLIELGYKSLRPCAGLDAEAARLRGGQVAFHCPS